MKLNKKNQKSKKPTDKFGLITKSILFLFLPILGFAFFSFLTYPLKPHCDVGKGLLGCTPKCEPISFFPDGRPLAYKEVPCFHGESSSLDFAMFKYKVLIPFVLFVGLSLWIYKEGFKNVIKKLSYIAFAPFFIFNENRKNRNIISRILVIGIIFFLIIEWALGYYVVFATFTGKDLLPLLPPQSQTQRPTPPNFTGQDIFDAINKYRKENGVPELKLDEVLCNNITQRYLDIKAGVKENIAHKGFDEWYKKYVEPYGYSAAENCACGQTPDDVIKAWGGSPSHRLSILDKKNKLACAYASEGCVVLILGYKTSPQAEGTNVYNPLPVNTPDPDPIVNCLINPECGGGSREMRRSQCQQSVCCQIGDKWYFYLDKNKCTEDQKNYRDTYYSKNSFSIPTYTPLTYYPCTICYPALGICSTYTHLYRTKEECDAAQQSVAQNSTVTTQDYSSPSQNNIPSMTKKECISQVNEKYRKIAVQYQCAYPCPETGECGTSSVCDAIWDKAKREIENCNIYP